MEYIDKLDEMFGIDDWEAAWLDESADSSEYLMALRMQHALNWNKHKSLGVQRHDYNLGDRLNRTAHLIDDLSNVIDSIYIRMSQLITFVEQDINKEQMDKLLNVLYWDSDMDFENLTEYCTVKHRVKHAVKSRDAEFRCDHCSKSYSKTLHTTNDIPIVPICSKCKESIKKTHGYVYLVQSPTKFYKIGRTKNPDDRIKTFGVKLPFEVDYVCVIHTLDMYSLESTLHQRFAPKRGGGEWFELDETDVGYIKGIAEKHDFTSYVLYSIEVESQS